MIHAGIKPQGPDRQAPAEDRSGQVNARMLRMWVAGSLETAARTFSPTIMDCERRRRLRRQQRAQLF